MRRKNPRWQYSEKSSALLSHAHSFRLTRLSRDLSSSQPDSNQDFIGAKAAAKWLAIPLRSLNLYVQQGLLPSYKLGRHRLFKRDELLAALNGSRRASRAEILR
jgi:excisionase family DNA binding protein